DLDQLKRQARELFHAYTGGQPDAVAEVNRFHHSANPADFALHDAQFALARIYGFDSWPKLKAYVDGGTIDRLVHGLQAGDTEQVQSMLRTRPELVNRSPRSANGLTPLHYAVMDRRPEMVRVLMRAGADHRTTTAGIYALREAANPLTIALERGLDEITSIIREEEARRESGRSIADDAPAQMRNAMQSGDEDVAI